MFMLTYKRAIGIFVVVVLVLVAAIWGWPMLTRESVGAGTAGAQENYGEPPWTHPAGGKRPCLERDADGHIRGYAHTDGVTAGYALDIIGHSA